MGHDGPVPTPHPWRAIPEGVDVRRVALPSGFRGVTDGRTIWLHNRLSQRERRSSLAHELAHHRLGHDSCQPPAVEERVRAEAARWLLPDIVVVGDALAWATSLDEAADELWVDRRTLQARLDHLHPSERHYLRRRLNEEEHQ